MSNKLFVPLHSIMEETITMYMDNKNRAFSMIADVEGDYSDLNQF